MNRIYTISTIALLVLLGVSACSAVQYRFKNKKNNETCIIFDTVMSLTVPYMTKTNKTENASWQVGKADSIDGMCDATKAELVLNFAKPKSSVMLRLSNENGKVQLELINVTVQVMESTTFKNAKNNETLMLTNNTKMELSSSKQYYVCDSEELTSLSNGGLMTISETRIQAFGIKNNSYTGEANRCAMDGVTSTAEPTESSSIETTETSSMTTPRSTVTPTTSPVGPLLNFTVKNPATGVVCLLAQMRLSFSIQYKDTLNASKTAKISVPLGSGSSGNCGNSTQTLSIKFNDGWVTELEFDGAKDQEYKLKTIRVDYKLDPKYFPNATDSGAKRTAYGNATYLNIGAHSYYMCSNEISFRINPNVSLVTENLKLQAFRSSNSTSEFTGSEVRCVADKPTDNIVPIIVGSALAVLVIIVLIAYIIGRRRSSGSGYQSV